MASTNYRNSITLRKWASLILTPWSTSIKLLYCQPLVAHRLMPPLTERWRSPYTQEHLIIALSEIYYSACRRKNFENRLAFRKVRRKSRVALFPRLRLDSHARNVARACYFHIRTLRHVRGSLTDDVAQTVACSTVSSRLDYCNALLCGAPEATFDKLQRVQDNLVRVVCQRGGRADASPLLRSLHWLPVRQRVTYKVALTTFKVRRTATPEYLSDLLQTHAPARSLRSSKAPTMVVTRTNTDRSLDVLSASRIHQSGTHYLLLLDSVTALQYLNDTWKHIYFHLVFSTAMSASASLDFKALYKLYYYFDYALALYK